MKGEKPITRYVEATLALEALRAQVAQFPQLKMSPVHKAQVTAAIVEADSAFRTLRGGWLGEARRRLVAERARIEAARQHAQIEEEINGEPPDP